MEKRTLEDRVSALKGGFPAHWQVSCSDHVNAFPFAHITIDNFFTDSEFREIQAHEADVKDNEIKILHSLISREGKVDSEIFEENFLQEINQRYLPALENILGLFAERKKPLVDYSDFHLVSTGPDYVHKVHDDVPRKLLSVVIYINPEKNNGTFIHKRKYAPEPVGEVEWKPNRAFIFSRRERKTWHSYAADGTNNRFCVVYNLNTHKVYRAHLAERNWIKYLKKRMRDQ